MPLVNSLTITPYTALYTNEIADTVISVGVTTREGRDEIVLDFNGGDGLWYRDFETAFSWPLSSNTILYTYQPSLIEKPETIYNRVTDWDDAGVPGNKLIRGFIMYLDTFGAAKVVQVQRAEDNAIYTTNESPATVDRQGFKPFTFTPPFVTHSMRVVNNDGVPWRLFGTEWVFDPWIEYATFDGPWTDLGQQGAKYIRGFVLPMDTQGIEATINVQTSDGQTITFTATTPSGFKTPVAFAFVPPIVAHDVRINMLTATAGAWVTEGRWDFDIYPEIIQEYTPIMELGGPDNKFFQGVKLIADTSNVAVSFNVLYDGGQTGPTFTGTFNGKQTLVFSWTPFTAHDIQLVPQGDARIWWGGQGEGQSEWMYQPVPELATNWTTELTSLGGKGWQHLRYIDFPYTSTEPITLTFTVDANNGSIAPQPLTIPSSGGSQTKLFLPVTFNKWRLLGFSATSSAPFSVWVQDFEAIVRSWGDTGPYRTVRPFGGQSSPGAGV